MPAEGWTPLPTLRSYDTAVHRAWVKAGGRGNVLLGIELTGELQAVRQQKGSTEGLTQEHRAEVLAGKAPYVRGAPVGRPYPPGAMEGPVAEAESLRDQRTLQQRGQPLAPAVPIPYMPGVPLSMRPSAAQPRVPSPGAPRREGRVIVIPREAREALRRYLQVLNQNPGQYTQPNIILGAAYALYTSRIGAPPFGFRVQLGPGGSRTFVPAADLPERGIRGSSRVPGELSADFFGPIPFAAETPVFYESVLALVYSVIGPAQLYNTNFSNILKDQFGWTLAGYLGGSRIETLRPPRMVPRGPPRHRTLGEPGEPPPFPQRGEGPLGRAHTQQVYLP
jgi:hypothetical protein